MQIISRANFQLSLKMLPFVLRIDMVADIQPASRKDVAENSHVGATVGFCLIRQSSASLIVCFDQSNQIPAPHSIGMPRHFLGVPWTNERCGWELPPLFFRVTRPDASMTSRPHHSPSSNQDESSVILYAGKFVFL
jgi:hypothetical protein